MYSSSSLSPNYGENPVILFYVFAGLSEIFFSCREPNVAPYKLLSKLHHQRRGWLFCATVTLGNVTVSVPLQCASEPKPLNVLIFWYLSRILEKCIFFPFKPLCKKYIQSVLGYMCKNILKMFNETEEEVGFGWSFGVNWLPERFFSLSPLPLYFRSGSAWCS